MTESRYGNKDVSYARKALTEARMVRSAGL